MKTTIIATGVAALVALPIATTLFLSRGGPVAANAMTFGEMTALELGGQGYRITPAMLSVVYKAFGETEEARIYDGLAEVAAGGALEQLYLERLGARAEDDVVTIDAKWRVLGTVGHAEHMHVRGNAYSASLTLEPVEGEWRLTGFELKDVDRTDAGGLQPQVDNPHFDVRGTPTE